MQTGLLVFTDFVGIVAFALAGILAAEGKNVDPVGVFVMAFTTAFGGGIVRDLIIDNRPMHWIGRTPIKSIHYKHKKPLCPSDCPLCFGYEKAPADLPTGAYLYS